MDFFVDLDRMPSFLSAFLTLSYPVPTPENPDCFPDATYYDIGYLDACFVVSLIAMMAILRDALRLSVLEPFARWKLTRDWRRRHENPKPHANDPPANGNGHSSEKSHAKSNGTAKELQLQMDSPEGRHIHRSVLRFGEQGWLTIYYIVQWSSGFYVKMNLPSDPWSGYPHIPLPGPVKLYYLMSMAVYLHLLLVINAEAPRKDHYQMLTHHIITVALIVISYAYNFTRIGCLIIVIMDWCDILLPFAKMLRYLALQTACDIAFVCFLISWVVTRIYMFGKAVLSTYSDAPRLAPFDWIPERGYYFTHDVHLVFVILLVSLEVIQTLWTYLVFRVAWRVVTGHEAADDRSDEDDVEEVKKDR